MLLSDDHGFLFVHIPKTGGTSVEQALVPEGQAIRPKHITAAEAVARFGQERYEALHTFTVVRDPMARFISHYAHLKTKYPQLRLGLWRRVGDWKSIEQYIEILEGDHQKHEGLRRRAMPQLSFVSVSGRLAVDTVLRLETLQADFDALCARLGIPQRVLPHTNRSTTQTVEISERVRRFVIDRYAVDYAAFGYSS